MKIEEGKKYLTANGLVVGPMEKIGKGSIMHPQYKFKTFDKTANTIKYYSSEGSYYVHFTSEQDIVSEYVENKSSICSCLGKLYKDSRNEIIHTVTAIKVINHYDVDETKNSSKELIKLETKYGIDELEYNEFLAEYSEVKSIEKKITQFKSFWLEHKHFVYTDSLYEIVKANKGYSTATYHKVVCEEDLYKIGYNYYKFKFV